MGVRKSMKKKDDELEKKKKTKRKFNTCSFKGFSQQRTLRTTLKASTLTMR